MLVVPSLEPDVVIARRDPSGTAPGRLLRVVGFGQMPGQRPWHVIGFTSRLL